MTEEQKQIEPLQVNSREAARLLSVSFCCFHQTWIPKLVALGCEPDKTMSNKWMWSVKKLRQAIDIIYQ